MEGVKIKIKKVLLIFIGVVMLLCLSKISYHFFTYSQGGIYQISESDLSFAASAGGTNELNSKYILDLREETENKWIDSEEFKLNYSSFMQDKDTVYIKLKLVDGNWTNPAIYFKGLRGQSYDVFLDGRIVYKSSENHFGKDLDLDTIYKDVIIPIGKPNLSVLNKELLMENTFHKDRLVIKINKGTNKSVKPVLEEDAILMGEHKNIIAFTIKTSIKKMVLNSVISAIAIVFAIIGILFKGRDRKILVSMSIFTLLMGIYGVASVSSINTILLDAPILWSYLYFLSLAYSPYSFACFFEHVFLEGHKKLINIIRKLQATSAAVLMGTVLLFTATRGEVDLIKYGTYTLYFSLLVLIVATLFASIAGTIKRSSEAAIFTVGISIYVYYIVSAMVNNENINEFGLILFILSQIILTATRFIKMAQAIVSNSKELELKNAELTEAWREVSSSKEEVFELNKTLEQRVLDRTKALEVSNKDLKIAMEKLQLTQNQLIQSEKMVALGGLVAGVSHEINTPVGVSVTAASHLQEKTKEITSLFTSSLMKKSDLDKYLALANESTEVILSNLRRAAELVKSFKQVAVDQSDEQERSFKIKEYIAQVLLSLKPKLKKTNISIGVNCEEELEIKSYPGALSQIVTNLVMNSLIHAFEEGQEGTIIFDIEKQGNSILFTYSDNGKGISSDIICKIFDPFFTTKRGKGGTGLGLNIVYNIVTQTLGGTIECESKEGLGTIFKIKFPI